MDENLELLENLVDDLKCACGNVIENAGDPDEAKKADGIMLEIGNLIDKYKNNG